MKRTWILQRLNCSEINVNVCFWRCVSLQTKCQEWGENGKRSALFSSCREKLESVPSVLHQVILLALLLCLESAKQDIRNENSHDLRVRNTKLKSMFCFPLPGCSTVELTFLLLLLLQFDVWIMFLIIFYFYFLLFYGLEHKKKQNYHKAMQGTFKQSSPSLCCWLCIPI